MTSCEEIKECYKTLREAYHILYEKVEPKTSAILASLKHRLMSVRDIEGTISRLKNKVILDEIDLYEIKYLALLNGAVKENIKELKLKGIEFPDLENVVKILDPEGVRASSFYIYNSYSKELASIRNELRTLKTKECLAHLMGQETDNHIVTEERELELLSREKLVENQIREELSDKLRGSVQELKTSLDKLGEIDILLAKCLQIKEMGLSLPDISENLSTSYKGMFHPYVVHLYEEYAQRSGGKAKTFTPIDIEFALENITIIGANMGGKTLILKMIALNQLLFQFGFGIAAASAVIDVKEGIEICIENEDDMSRGYSSFASEVIAIEALLKRVLNGEKILAVALRQVLGTHVEQKGSLVDDQRLRFDFSHFAKMTPEEIQKVEKIVNQKIRENIPNVTYAEIPIDEAKAMGATALFGEKYGDKVRVVVFDKDYSMELCGGCHTSATGNIGMFKIVSEGAIAAGIRRIEAITGEAVEQYLDEQLDLIGHLRECVKSPDLVKAVTSLNEQNSALKKEVEHLMQEKAQAMAEKLHEKALDHEGYKLIMETLPCGGDQLRNIALLLKQMNESTIAILGSVAEGKPSLCLLLPESFADAKDLDATKLIREVAKEIQGGGGGQKTLCVAGGRNADGLPKAMQMLKEKI